MASIWTKASVHRFESAGQKYAPCQIQIQTGCTVTGWFLHASPHLFNPSLYVCFLKGLNQTLVLCIHFPLCRDYTRPDLPSGDSETSGATASGLPDITAALSGMYTSSSTCVSFTVKKENRTSILFTRLSLLSLYTQDLKNIKNVKRCRDGMPKSMQTR